MLTQENTLSYSSDSEYQPKTDEKTLPITVQLAFHDADGELIYKCFLHPQAFIQGEPRHKHFKSPFVFIDALELGWRWSSEKAYGTRVFESEIFRSLKDLQFQFADEQLFRDSVLPFVEKTRRYRISGYHNRDYILIKDNLGKNLQVKTTDNKGVLRWFNVGVKLTDVSAMMGVGGLIDYGKNTGLLMKDKANFSHEEKGRFSEMYSDVERADAYMKGDVVGEKKVNDSEIVEVQLLRHIITTVNDQINKIACLLGIQPLAPSESWGMSTGTIVAKLISKVIADRIGVTIDQLQQLTQHGGATSLQNLGRYLKLKDNFIYLTMVDGGRANNEKQLLPGSKVTSSFVNRKVKGVYTGVLCDLDISGCYANGLMNQLFPIGIPQVIVEPMSFRTLIDEYLPKFVPGCWYARVNWNDAPFAQDLLISKVPEAYTDWDYGIDGYTPDGFEYEADESKTYDAGMLVTTNSVHQASLNHDLLQTLYSCASKPRKGKKADGSTEWEWLLDNAMITGLVYYDKSLQVDKVSQEMIESVVISKDPNVHTKCSKNWVCFSLREIMSVLIPERAKAKRVYGKKSSEQTFLKLVNNTIYGCIASTFFNTGETVISNVVVGNNITARARTLAWLMAKGLGSFQSVTDGGVFDVNQVVHWQRITLDNLSKLYYDQPYDNKRHRTYTKKPLLTKVLTDDVLEGYEGWRSQVREQDDFGKTFDCDYLQDDIDFKAWEHLKQQFTGIDLLEHDQFVFESKRLCLGFTPHNKVNYCLYDIVAGDNAGDSHYIALRGMNKVYKEGKQDKVVNPEALKLFDGYENNQPVSLTIETTKLLSLADWRMLKESHPEKYNILLPDDQVSDVKTFYSITPLNFRYPSLAHYFAVQKEYQDAKKTGDADKVANVGLTDESLVKANTRLQRLLRK